MKRRFSEILCFLALLQFTNPLPLLAQVSEDPYWLVLEKGKQYFRNSEYGKALNAFEDAKRKRDAVYSKMQKDWIDFLSLNEVRALGDSLGKLELFLKDKPNKRISDIISEIKYQYKDTVIQDSSQKIIGLIDQLRIYPEAEYWIGEVYRIEGELKIALKQYERSLSQQLAIENNGFTTVIRYKIAEMHYLLKDYLNYEKVLINILSSDTLWSADTRSQSFIRTAMFKTLTEDGINRFLVLYRYDLTDVEQAHRKLGFYYYATGRYDKAVEHLTYAFLIQNTLLIKEIQRREYGFIFSDYTQLLRNLERYVDLEPFIIDIDYYKTNYYLAAALFAVGQRSTAFSLWTILSKYEQAEEWQKRSQTQLKKPFIEPINQQP
ncbi:hypothetical protein [Gracilinema caldarium]|uniref:hypothetical protein n=1 Tax=Gracilinema caldarium TaxID=215591 RepID=UPI0026EF4788|nr:hypothetical protein [Gracilinema caldarium]